MAGHVHGQEAAQGASVLGVHHDAARKRMLAVASGPLFSFSAGGP